MQGVPFRGDAEETDSIIELQRIRGLDDPRIDLCLSKRTLS